MGAHKSIGTSDLRCKAVALGLAGVTAVVTCSTYLNATVAADVTVPELLLNGSNNGKYVSRPCAQVLPRSRTKVGWSQHPVPDRHRYRHRHRSTGPVPNWSCRPTRRPNGQNAGAAQRIDSGVSGNNSLHLFLKAKRQGDVYMYM